MKIQIGVRQDRHDVIQVATMRRHIASLVIAPHVVQRRKLGEMTMDSRSMTLVNKLCRRAMILFLLAATGWSGALPARALEFEAARAHVDATIEQVLQRLGVPADQARVIFVDTRAASLDDALRGGEQVGVFPAIAGG